MRRLVNLLLMVMIAGFITIIIALLMRLKEMPSIGVAPLEANERILDATASADRISLTLRNDDTATERVIILDAATFKPIAVLNPPSDR